MPELSGNVQRRIAAMSNGTGADCRVPNAAQGC